MKISGITKAFAIFATLYMSMVASAELRPTYIVEDSCPFEGCAYGKWEVIKETPIYKEARLDSKIIGKLNAGTTATIETGVSYITPGKAKITGKPYKTAKALDRNEYIYILNYIGEGYSKVFQNGHVIETKVARTNTQCSENPNWRYCWVYIMKEPIDQWWVKVQGLGWVPMETNPLKPIDALSQIMPYNKALQLTTKSGVPIVALLLVVN